MEPQGRLSDAELVRRAMGTTTPEQRKAALTADETANNEGPGTAAGTVLAASRPHPARRLGARLRRRPAVAALIVVAALAAAVSGAAAMASSSGLGPGIITVDDEGAPLNPKVLVIASQVLRDARAHDSEALGRLLDPTDPTSAKVVALNKLLAQPGVYAQITTLLTKTHSVQQDGFIGWPGFLLAGTGSPLDAADAKTLGVTSPQEYKGISIIIGAAYTENPYIPKLGSISQFVA
jgi:hypothetical protein